ncbi:Aste57867_19157 [Aphanomyces stellatus]|uniref:beta-glucosidase n=1 Tax=Aphanomyces stellatus TaxID=120398 RepID=A0A485LC72_9STRA|nr:hypothetical protein As57867_019093 [Aphanomyces stellatus]VFT95879.1 Aste57867_19157 [Aphanomyces stellatus]
MKVPSLLLTLAPLLAQGVDFTAQADAIVNTMSVAQLLGQMNQVVVSSIDVVQGAGFAIDPAKVQSFANQGVGSYLDTPFAGTKNSTTIGWTAVEWRAALTQIQTIHTVNGGLPIIYGLDSLHGAQYVKGAVIFPHQINIGATFNPAFATSMGQFASRDTKAAGITWIFGPCLDIARHKHWPRIFETYGEDPLVVSNMASNIVRAMQYNGVAATFKHFIGYSASAGGIDHDSVTLTTHEILNLFVPSFKAAIDAGIMTGMGNYIALNGTPMAANHAMLVDLLRHDLQFDGMQVSDYREIYMMFTDKNFATSNQDAVLRAINNGTYDMSMVPVDTSFITYMQTLYNAGQISLDRIKTSVKRIIKLKLQVGLFDSPVPGAELVASVGDAPSQAAAKAAADESLVLLKNANNVLPLDSTKKIFLTGSSIDDIGLLCGGWSLTWQGQAGNAIFPSYGRTIRGAVAGFINNPSRTTFYQGVAIDGTWQDINQAKALAQAADYTIVAIGEPPYAETFGNTDSYALPSGLTDYVKALATTGTKIILILVEGRPRLLNGIADVAAAIVFAGLPCEMGGEAISDALFGVTNPSGKMALTYPKTADETNMATPYYGRVGDNCSVQGVTSSCPAEWQFGQGLSYTTFDYSNMQLSASALTPVINQVTVTVTIKNTGAKRGKEAVLLFLSAPNVPETKLLKAYTKVELAAGQSTTVSFTLQFTDFAVYVNEIGQGLQKDARAGTYYLGFKYDTICNSASSIGALCQAFTWNAFCLRMDAYNMALSNVQSDQVAFVPSTPGDTRQEWYLDPATKSVTNRGSQRCLDAYQGWNGGAVHTWDCSATNSNQQWSYNSATQQLQHATYSGFCLDLGATMGTAPHLWQCLPTSNPDYKNQRIVLATTSNLAAFLPGYNRVLSASDPSTIQFQSPVVPSALAQQWQFDALTRLVRSVGTTTCLDAYQGWNGGAVHLWACSAANANQQWRYNPTTQQLQHATYSGFCLDIGSADGMAPHLWQCLATSDTNYKNQQIVLSTMPLLHVVKNAAFGLALTASDPATIQFQTPLMVSSLSQQWLFEASTRLLRSVGANTCLDAYEGWDGGAVHLWGCNFANGNQMWAYDLWTQQLRHMTYDGFCLDVGGSLGSMPHLWTCLPAGHADLKNQQFQIA